jgi:hypothetical protein
MAITPLDTSAYFLAEMALKAPLSSPAFTDTPAAPTAAAGTDTTQLATTAFVREALAAPVKTETASYTLVLADGGKWVRMSVASANDLTVPPNSSVAFPVGTEVHIENAGAGQTTVVAGSGVTVRTPETLKLAAQYAVATLKQVATDEWVLAGYLEAAP